MNKYHYLGTLIFSLFLSCSDSAIKEPLLIPETLVPIDGFDDDPLGIVQSFSEGLSLKEQRISAFVNGNRRVSIIDTENLREKWGRSLDYEFSRSFPIPDLDGVFLISQERMLLVTENEEHFIDLNGSRYNRYARSEQKAVYVALNGDSGDFLVARRDQGGGISQQEIVLAQANVNHSSRGPGDYSFIPFIDPLGTRVLVLEQNSGAYFMIGASISELDADQLRCLPAKFESDGPVPEEELIKLTAGSLNKEGSKLIFATSSHRLGQIDIDGTCKDLYDAAEAGLELEVEVKRIVPRAGNNFLVIQSDNIVKEFTLENNEMKEVSSVSSQCPESTVTANYLSDNRLLSVCLNSSGSYDGKYFAVDFIVSDPPNNKVLYSYTVNNKEISGVAIDKDQSRIFLIGNDAIGRVEQIHYETSEVKVNDSFYVEGLLDRL